MWRNCRREKRIRGFWLFGDCLKRKILFFGEKQMGRLLFSALFLLLAIFAAYMATGRRSSALPGGCQRIVSLAPAITDTLYALGTGDRIAAVTRFCKTPPEVAAKPALGGFREVNLEAIARLETDLVILPADMAHYSEDIEALGIPVLLFDYSSLPAFLSSVENLGEECQSDARARRLVEEFTAAVKPENTAHPPTALIVLLNPGEYDSPPSEMTIVGSDEFYNGLIAAAGGRNAYSGAVPFPSISLEALIAMRPDLLVLAAPGIGDPAKLESAWRENGNLQGALPARLLVLTHPSDTVPGPAALATIKKLNRAIRALREGR